MRLYHGTSTKHLDKILLGGLKPRKDTGHESNWEGAVESRKHLVYLTDVYSVFYATATTEDTDSPVVLCVEVDEQKLYPDEDFIAYCLQKDWSHTPSEIDPIDYQRYSDESLRHNGTVSTRTIPAVNIIDYRIIPWIGNELLLLNIGMDATPTVMNHLILGDYYRKCTKALFRYDLAELPDVVKDLHDEDAYTPPTSRGYHAH